MATSAPPFWVKIDEVRGTGPEIHDQWGYWSPPDRMNWQSKTATTGWLYCLNGRIDSTVNPFHAPGDANFYKQATIYYCDGRFWVVPYDATQWDVCRVPPDEYGWLPGWRALTFDHCPNGVSGVGFEHTETKLATQRQNQTWRRELFPDGCLTTDVNDQPGGLQGKLTLILALAAFSAPAERTVEAITRSFNLGRWVPHGLGHGRRNKRGVVVTVCLDHSSTKEDLQAFEDGHRGGPIFA